MQEDAASLHASRMHKWVYIWSSYGRVSTSDLGGERAHRTREAGLQLRRVDRASSRTFNSFRRDGAPACYRDGGPARQCSGHRDMSGDRAD